MYKVCLQDVVEWKAAKNGGKVQVSQILNYISLQSKKQCKASQLFKLRMWSISKLMIMILITHAMGGGLHLFWKWIDRKWEMRGMWHAVRPGSTAYMACTLNHLTTCALGSLNLWSFGSPQCLSPSFLMSFSRCVWIWLRRHMCAVQPLDVENIVRRSKLGPKLHDLYPSSLFPWRMKKIIPLKSKQLLKTHRSMMELWGSCGWW